MAIIPAITIPDADLPDVVAALEVWKPETMALVGGKDAYDLLTDRQKIRQALIAVIRFRVRNLRRERAERAVSLTDVNVA